MSDRERMVVLIKMTQYRETTKETREKQKRSM